MLSPGGPCQVLWPIWFVLEIQFHHWIIMCCFPADPAGDCQAINFIANLISSLNNIFKSIASRRALPGALTCLLCTLVVWQNFSRKRLWLLLKNMVVCSCGTQPYFLTLTLAFPKKQLCVVLYRVHWTRVYLTLILILSR